MNMSGIHLFVKPERKLLAVISIRFFVIFVVDEK